MKKLKSLRLPCLLWLSKKGILTALGIGALLFGCSQEETPAPVNEEPTCVITSPFEGDEFLHYDDVIFEIDAEDVDGFIVEVRFFINGVPVGSSNSFPYKYTMENPAMGSYDFKATALDAAGGSSSDQINVIVTNVQGGLDSGITPIEIFQNNSDYLDSLYGKTYQGGVIFYLDVIDGSGLVVAPDDQSTGIVWANSSTITHATKYGIGTGQANTTAIVNALGDGEYAAKLCDDLELDGYSDWFLPNTTELYALIENVPGELSNNIYYWSSQEWEASSAWCFSGKEGGNWGFSTPPKNSLKSVRAIRAF